MQPAQLDLINGLFETGGALASIFNVRRIRRDKSVAGVCWPVTAFFATWGYWNLIYYSGLNQPLSLVAGFVLALSSTVWVLHAVYYERYRCA
jgi:Kef-type K+ transport system membrane component KefB